MNQTSASFTLAEVFIKFSEKVMYNRITTVKT